jgi:hypothetical protein
MVLLNHIIEILVLSQFHILWQLFLGELIPQIPPDTEQNDLCLILTPLKRVGLGHGNESLPVALSQLTTRRLGFCNTTG